jgi:hypothetical protein
MTTRDLQPEDIPKLKALHEASGFNYAFPDLTKMVAASVVVDNDGCIVAASAAEPILQLYLWVSPKNPATNLLSIRLLHKSLRDKLSKFLYSEANAFLPPEIARSFGRRLERTFGWVKNWDSWCIRF